MIVAYDWVVEHSNDKRRRVLIYGLSDKSVALTTRLFKSTHYRVVGFLNYGTKMSGYKLSEHKTYYFRNEEDVDNFHNAYCKVLTQLAENPDMLIKDLTI